MRILFCFIFLSLKISAENSYFFKKISQSELKKSKKKVFAVYMDIFQLNMNNAKLGNDYWTRNFLNPFGESSKYLAQGGFLRDRPADFLISSYPEGSDYKTLNFLKDVDLAMKIGIDGFSVNVFDDVSPWLKYFKALDEKKIEFKVALMLDGLNQKYYENPVKACETQLQLTRFNSVYRNDKGEVVLYPFNASIRDEDWWRDFLGCFRKNNVPVSLIPISITGGPGSYLDNVRSGISWWGSATFRYIEDLNVYNYIKLNKDEILQAPVRLQDFRPKSLIGSESSNSSLFRKMWDLAISSNVNQVQIVTWNDYSESTQIRPSIGSQWALYDLTDYYVQWFKTGKKPEILNDTLFYFHRNQPHTAKFNSKYQQKNMILDSPEDNIEVLTFLTKPGVLVTNVLNKKNSQYVNKVSAGMTSVKNPLKTGELNFILYRDKKSIVQLKSKHNVYNPVNTQDFSYKSGGSNRK